MQPSWPARLSKRRRVGKGQELRLCDKAWGPADKRMTSLVVRLAKAVDPCRLTTSTLPLSANYSAKRCAPPRHTPQCGCTNKRQRSALAIFSHPHQSSPTHHDTSAPLPRLGNILARARHSFRRISGISHCRDPLRKRCTQSRVYGKEPARADQASLSDLQNPEPPIHKPPCQRRDPHAKKPRQTSFAPK